MAKVIALAGWPPEILAYALAKYSRSALSIQESIVAITNEKSQKFLNDFYFQFGHASIADNAKIPLALEGISEIAAFELEKEQLWDGCERSTRYQNFKSGGFIVPDSVRGTATESAFVQTAEFLLERYHYFSGRVFEQLVKDNPKPAEMKDDQYERTLRARAFDVSRYWLFNGILTSVGQITSARILERQISRLLSSEYPELIALGEQMKLACAEKPFCPEGKNEPPLAPTLLKYAAPNEYQIYLRNLMEKQLLKRKLRVLQERYVRLAPYLRLEDEVIATLLFEFSNYAYYDLIHAVQHFMDKEDKTKFLDLALARRGNHDPLPKAFETGYKIQFEIAMDRGGERDLHRHRNCTQIHQPLTVERGWDTPSIITEMGLANEYNEGMAKVSQTVQKLKQKIGKDADYLIPFAFRSGTIYKMHLAEAAYIIELRTGPKGHFSYREISYKMYEELVKRFPFMEKRIKATPLSEGNLLLR